ETATTRPTILQAAPGLSLGQAIYRLEFWGFFTIFGASAISVFGVSLQAVAYLVEQGFSKVEAAFAFGFVGMLTILGIALTGILAERFPRHIVATGSYGLTIAGITALAALQFYQSWALLVIFVVCFGLSAGARGPIITAQMAELFNFWCDQYRAGMWCRAWRLSGRLSV
ncbi:MAG: MFS transporter, partial [Alphaproteobacteria bacterium]|nr:MFS transporter [Alphaproteobacteria bacterium]